MEFEEADIAGEEPEDIVGRGINLVPKHQNTVYPVSVHENFEMSGSIRDSDIHGRIQATYDVLPALKRHDTENAAALSGGQ